MPELLVVTNLTHKIHLRYTKFVQCPINWFERLFSEDERDFEYLAENQGVIFYDKIGL